MDKMDLKLKLFGGVPIEAKGYGHIAPLKVRDIIEVGYSEYMKLLNIFTLDKNDFYKEEYEEEMSDVNMVEILIYSSDEDFRRDLKKAFKLFLGKEALIDKQDLCIHLKSNDGDVKVVDRSNYDNIVEVIKLQNFIIQPDDSGQDKSENLSEKAKKFKEKMKKLNKKVAEIKSKQNGDDGESELTLYDILESLASKSYSINELNILDLTIYQVYRKFKRLDAIDKYDINIKSMLAGAKNVKLKHWSASAD